MTRRPNPPRDKKEAIRLFRELIIEPDPASISIAEDLVMDGQVTLVEASMSPQVSLDARRVGVVAVGEFKVAESIKTATKVRWLVEKNSSTNFTVTLEWAFQDRKQREYPGENYREKEHAKRAAAADAWAIAKALKVLDPGHPYRAPDPEYAGDWNLIRHRVATALVGKEDKTPLEVYGHKRNPAAEPPEDALEKYREFHRLEPSKVGAMPELVMPTRLRLAGDSKWVTYRSGKVDPSTLRRPSSSQDYIHEHDAGVRTYVPDGTRDTDVPRELANCEALVKLGSCLGFCFADHTGKEIEAEGKAPLPELYCTPNGKVLLVIQSKREILAMMWGGALGVFARGIDG